MLLILCIVSWPSPLPEPWQAKELWVNLSNITKQKIKVTVLDTPAFNPADEIQQEENIEKLKNKTMSVSAFNKLYGVGTAESILKK